MIKKNILMLISSFIFIQMNGQKMRFGANAGATYSTFRGNSFLDKASSGLGFLAGVSFEYYLKERLSLKTNISYENKSIVSTIALYDDFGVPVNYTSKIYTSYNYLVIPVLIKYDFGKSNSFFINGGFFTGYLLKSVNKLNDAPSDDFTYLNKKLDIGLSAGIGKTYKINDNNDFVIEVRENLGLINTSSVGVIDDGSIKTNSLNLILGWSFGI